MNPLMNAIGGQPTNTGNIEQIKRMMNMFKSIQNPQEAMNQLAKQNPMVANIIQMSNGDLKGTFYKMCQEKGVNPDDILKQLQN